MLNRLLSAWGLAIMLCGMGMIQFLPWSVLIVVVYGLGMMAIWVGMMR